MAVGDAILRWLTYDQARPAIGRGSMERYSSRDMMRLKKLDGIYTSGIFKI
jgi:hypothetical protein